MKKNYNPKKLTKQQKHMKKWIPDYHYCEGIYGIECPFYEKVWYDTSFYEKVNLTESDYSKSQIERITNMMAKNYNHKKEECQFSNRCKRNCNECKVTVSHCHFLNYTEYGQYPLGDMCKICEVHTLDRKEYRRNIHGHYFKARGWKAKRKNKEKFNKQLKARMKWYPELWENDSYDKLKETWRDLVND